MKRHFLLLNIFLFFGVLNAQETYRFRTDHPQGFSVESSTASGLSLHYSLSEIDLVGIDNGKAKGQEIIMKGSFGSFAEGLPNLPFENRYIAVPRGATVGVKVKEKGCQTLNGIDLLPAAAVQGNAAIGMPKIQKDMSVFGKDANFPTDNVAIAQTTQIRGLDMVMLSVTPFRYNPVRKTLEVIYDMDIEIRFEGGNGQFGDARYLNPAWDKILRDLVINSDMLPEAHYYDLLNKAIRNKEEGCEYLIISPDDEGILAYADTLKQFRTKQGILTKVVTTTQCGGNEPEAIKSYIQNAYENWAIPPAAVMIFSGYHDTIDYYSSQLIYGLEGIGGFPLTFHGYENDGYTYDSDYLTDNIYADMNADSIPDMAISRLSAISLKEYQTQIRKLISYESNPPTDPHYYDHPVITSGFENNKWFMITSQSVNGFFCNKLGLHPSNFYMQHELSAEPNIPDSVWSTGYNTEAPFSYFGPDGQGYFPRYICELNEWKDMWENDYLIDAISEGTFFTMFRGHSGSSAWCFPYFYSHEIPKLDNINPTFVFSIGCNTALYERQYSYYDEGESMLTAFCNAPTGALGGIGAVTVTRSHFNDILTWGMVDYLWPEFMPTLGTATTPDFARPAYALIAGKLFLGQHAFLPNWWPGYLNDTYHVFHYIGEAYLNLYTEVPQQMAIDASPYTNSKSQYTMTAEEGATICLSHDGEILVVTQATGRPQDLTLPNLPIGEQFIVTVTKQNRFRFEQTVRVVSSTLPCVYVKNVDLKDQDGNGQLDYSEYADIDITLNNYSEVASADGEITLRCTSPYIEIVQGSARYPQMGANAIYTVENAFRIKLANNVPDQTRIQLKVHFNEGENTHEDNINIIANAPVVTINPKFRLMMADGEPSTHINTEGSSSITFSVKNTGHSSIDLLQANLYIKAPFVNVENVPQHENLMPNEEWSLTHELNSTPNDITGAWLQSRLDVQYGEHHIHFDTIIQYGGIFENFETDTLNPFFMWTNNGSHPWEYCTNDAYEGERCLISTADTATRSQLKARLRSQLIDHDGKISFYYKTDPNECLTFYLRSLNESTMLSSPEWHYAEATFSTRDIQFNWMFEKENLESQQVKIDNLCFPPKHTSIAYAGDDLMLCKENTVELSQAYAYDCDSVRWITDGDGHFEDNASANTVYHPGNQDITNGIVNLTLLAFKAAETLGSTTMVTLLDAIDFEGMILGDSIVNKYEHPICHYSIEHQEGINYRWQLEPAELGVIYDQGNTIDIAWNLYEDDAEVTLSVTAENGCDVEPITKTISLIGYSTPEWQSVSFDLFPNPTDGKVNLVIGETLQGKAVVEVYNLLGERMMAKSTSCLQKGETMSLDLSHLVSGLYIIKLSTENGSCTKKVSVK